MSDSKWRRLFESLDSRGLGLHQVIWKFVGRDREFRSSLPSVDQLKESYVVDFAFNDFPYKEIEWVEVPAVAIPYGWEQVPAKHSPQDLERVTQTLTDIGQFEIERRERGLRIYGWR